MQINFRASQACEVQSLLSRQPWPSAHGVQIPPPQSASVSTPSCCWSKHWLAMHVNPNASQALEAQSVFCRHFCRSNKADRLRRSPRPYTARSRTGCSQSTTGPRGNRENEGIARTCPCRRTACRRWPWCKALPWVALQCPECRSHCTSLPGTGSRAWARCLDRRPASRCPLRRNG